MFKSLQNAQGFSTRRPGPLQESKVPHHESLTTLSRQATSSHPDHFQALERKCHETVHTNENLLISLNDLSGAQDEDAMPTLRLQSQKTSMTSGALVSWAHASWSSAHNEADRHHLHTLVVFRFPCFETPFAGFRFSCSTALFTSARLTVEEKLSWSLDRVSNVWIESLHG